MPSADELLRQQINSLPPDTLEALQTVDFGRLTENVAPPSEDAAEEMRRRLSGTIHGGEEPDIDEMLSVITGGDKELADKFREEIGKLSDTEQEQAKVELRQMYETVKANPDAFRPARKPSKAVPQQSARNKAKAKKKRKAANASRKTNRKR